MLEGGGKALMAQPLREELFRGRGRGRVFLKEVKEDDIYSNSDI